MLPKRRNGDDTKPSDYEFDPEKDELARCDHPLTPRLTITPVKFPEYALRAEQEGL